MQRKHVVIGGLGLALFLVFYYLYGGSTVPEGQRPLVGLNSSNLGSLKNDFNASADTVRLLVLVSPT
jgi:hypothetical protein